MALVIIGYGLMGIAIIDLFSSFIVMLSIHPGRSIWLDLFYVHEFKEEDHFFFRFRNLSMAFFYVLVFAGNFLFILSGLMNNGDPLSIFARFLIAIVLIPGCIGYINLIREDYLDWEEFWLDFKEYITLKTHLYYLYDQDLD